jgi:hypothetical protein
MLKPNVSCAFMCLPSCFVFVAFIAAAPRFGTLALAISGARGPGRGVAARKDKTGGQARRPGRSLDESSRRDPPTLADVSGASPARRLPARLWPGRDARETFGRTASGRSAWGAGGGARFVRRRAAGGPPAVTVRALPHGHRRSMLRRLRFRAGSRRLPGRIRGRAWAPPQAALRWFRKRVAVRSSRCG